MSEWVFQFVIAELFWCGAFGLIDEIVREHEYLPPGAYSLEWTRD